MIPNQSNLQTKQAVGLSRGGANEPNKLLIRWLRKQDTKAAKVVLREALRSSRPRRSVRGKGAISEVAVKQLLDKELVLEETKAKLPRAVKEQREAPLQASNAEHAAFTLGWKGIKRRVLYVREKLGATPDFLNTPPPAPELIRLQDWRPEGPPVYAVGIQVGVRGNIIKVIQFKEGNLLYTNELAAQLLGSNYTVYEAERAIPGLKTFNINEYDLIRVLQLATDLQSGLITYQSFREGMLMLQCEQQNLLRDHFIKNISRLNMQLAKTLNPDFICLGEILIIDVKKLVGVQALINQNQK